MSWSRPNREIPWLIETGHPPQDIARAFIIARDVFRLRDIWHGVEALDNVVDAGFQNDGDGIPVARMEDTRMKYGGVRRGGQ